MLGNTGMMVNCVLDISRCVNLVQLDILINPGTASYFQLLIVADFMFGDALIKSFCSHEILR